MSKIVTVSGHCGTTKKPVNFQFKREDDGSYVLVGSFTSSSSSSTGSMSDVTGKFYLSDSFKCKLCGNKSVYFCGNCGAVVCWDEHTFNGLVCPSCGKTSNINTQSSSDPISVKADKRQ